MDDRLPDLIQEVEIHVRSIPWIKRLFSDTAVHHGATKSASDRRHGSPRRTVRIRLDIGRRLRRCRDRRLSEGPGLRATIIDLPNIAPVAETFIAEAGLSDRVSTLAADGVAAPPASLPLQRRSGRKDGGSVAGNVRGPLRHAAAHSMEPGRIFIVGHLDVSRASPPLFVGATATRNCRNIATARERALHRQNGFGLPAARSINAPLEHDTRPDGNRDQPVGLRPTTRSTVAWASEAILTLEAFQRLFDIPQAASCFDRGMSEINALKKAYPLASRLSSGRTFQLLHGRHAADLHANEARVT